MRNEFVKSLINLAETNSNVFLLCGDLGFSVLEPFAEKFPDRFINVGIAEQNMIGIAAGLALTGKKVFTYSIVNFAVTRCLEQIRNDICYHNLDVTIVAVGGGMPYGSQGYTHLGIEDIAFTRNLPNIKVMVPADREELNFVMQKIDAIPGPHYLRVGRGGEPDIHQKNILTCIRNEPINTKTPPIIEIYKPQEITFLTTGAILNETKSALDKFYSNLQQEHSISTSSTIGLISVPEISHQSREYLKAYLNHHSNIKKIITIEEHLVYGGFGSFISELVPTLNNDIKLHSLGIKHENLTEIGNQDFLKQKNGIDVMSILDFITSLQVFKINEIC